jgi:hypothetical protein
MAYDLFTRKHNKTDASRIPMHVVVNDSSMGAELKLSSEDREALVKTGEKVKTAGVFILTGLVIVAIAEIVGHRNMSFKGDGFFHHYKNGRGVK